MGRSEGIRGRRVGSEPGSVVGRPGGPAVDRRAVSYWCAAGHETPLVFAADVADPGVWDCRRCGAPAGPDRGHPPAAGSHDGRHKTPLQFLHDRRTDTDADALLDEALARHRAGRAD